MKRDVTIQLRATDEERDQWRKLAKPYSLSEYIRQLLNAELRRREAGEGWRVEE